MISNLKREALSSLKGRWGLGVGSTFLNYLIPAASMYFIGIVVFLIFGLFIDVLGPENLVYYSYGEPQINFGVILSQIIIWAI
ncbi:hypothetical protein FC700_29330, partial [Bacillus mycoides]